MPELHPGPGASLGQLEAQLRALGLEFNSGFYYTRVGGQWCLAVSDESYQRWQDATAASGSAAPAPGKATGSKSTTDAPAVAVKSADKNVGEIEGTVTGDTGKGDNASSAPARKTGSKSKGR